MINFPVLIVRCNCEKLPCKEAFYIICVSNSDINVFLVPQAQTYTIIKNDPFLDLSIYINFSVHGITKIIAYL